MKRSQSFPIIFNRSTRAGLNFCYSRYSWGNIHFDMSEWIYFKVNNENNKWGPLLLSTPELKMNANQQRLFLLFLHWCWIIIEEGLNVCDFECPIHKSKSGIVNREQLSKILITKYWIPATSKYSLLYESARTVMRNM